MVSQDLLASRNIAYSVSKALYTTVNDSATVTAAAVYETNHISISIRKGRANEPMGI